MRTCDLTPTTLDHDADGGGGPDLATLSAADDHVMVANEQRFRLIAQHTRDLICLSDADWRLAYVSPAIEPLLGYRPEELIGTPLPALVHADDWAALRDGAARPADPTAPPVPVTCRLIARWGECRWLETLAQPIVDALGAVAGFQTSSRDVTARVTAEMERDALLQQAQAARAEAEASLARLSRLQTLTAALSTARTRAQVAEAVVEHAFAAESVLAALVTLISDDRQQFTLLASRGLPPAFAAAWRTFPADAEVAAAVAVRRGEPVVLGDLHERVTHAPEFLTDAGNGSTIALPIRAHERAIGSLAIVVGEAAPLADTDWPFLLTVADLCGQALERARLYDAEHTLREQVEAERDWLQQVIDVIPEGIAIVDQAGAFVVRNAAAWSILGRELLGRPIVGGDRLSAWMRRSDGTELRSRDLPLQRALFAGEVVRGELLVTRHTELGREVPLLVSTAPVRDTQGGIVGAVATFQDISDLKRAEAARDEFVSSLSHDLRAPLTVIQGLAAGLRRRAIRRGTPDDRHLVARLDGILGAGARMTTQLDELVEAARLRLAHPLDLNRWPVDLVRLVRRLVEEHGAGAETHTVSLDAHVSELVGLYDETKLARAIGNLLDNAIKYSPTGGEVRLRFSVAAGTAGEEAVLSISDTGVGIPAGDLPRLFERGRRGANVVGRFAGTGLGLAGARQIIAQHGGTIEVQSREGVGSTFTVRLPLVTAPRQT